MILKQIGKVKKKFVQKQDKYIYQAANKDISFQKLCDKITSFCEHK